MTNFKDLKPYIRDKTVPPNKVYANKMKAIEAAVKIIRENKRIVEEAKEPSHENPHR